MPIFLINCCYCFWERGSGWNCNINGWLISDLARTAQVVIAFYFYVLYFAFIFDSLNLYLATLLTCMHCNCRAPKIAISLPFFFITVVCVLWLFKALQSLKLGSVCLSLIELCFEKWNKRKWVMFVYIFYVLSWNNIELKITF